MTDYRTSVYRVAHRVAWGWRIYVNDRVWREGYEATERAALAAAATAMRDAPSSEKQ